MKKLSSLLLVFFLLTGLANADVTPPFNATIYEYFNSGSASAISSFSINNMDTDGNFTGSIAIYPITGKYENSSHISFWTNEYDSLYKGKYGFIGAGFYNTSASNKGSFALVISGDYGIGPFELIMAHQTNTFSTYSGAVTSANSGILNGNLNIGGDIVNFNGIYSDITNQFSIHYTYNGENYTLSGRHGNGIAGTITSKLYPNVGCGTFGVYLPQPVPEPTSIVAIVSGLIAIGTRFKRR